MGWWAEPLGCLPYTAGWQQPPKAALGQRSRPQCPSQSSQPPEARQTRTLGTGSKASTPGFAAGLHADTECIQSATLQEPECLWFARFWHQGNTCCGNMYSSLPSTRIAPCALAPSRTALPSPMEHGSVGDQMHENTHGSAPCFSSAHTKSSSRRRDHPLPISPVYHPLPLQVWAYQQRRRRLLACKVHRRGKAGLCAGCRRTEQHTANDSVRDSSKRSIYWRGCLCIGVCLPVWDM